MPAPFFRIEMLPALHGDCLWIEYGDTTRTRRVLIDGGPIDTYPYLQTRIDSLPADDRCFELVVMTHVDIDHLAGLVRLFANKPVPIVPKDIWFNGWRHIEPGTNGSGDRQGEFISALIARRFPESRWNAAFAGKAVVIPDEGPLPEYNLPGGLTLTLLSPTRTKLENMRNSWAIDRGPNVRAGNCENAWQCLAERNPYLPGPGLMGITPEVDALIAEQFTVDNSVANGSSIAFLAELQDKCCLFLADAHQEVITASLQRLLVQRGLPRLRVDAVKLSHHGCSGKVSDELLALIESPRFLISTNGDQFKHPDEEAMLRIIAHSVHRPPTLYFNYLSDSTRPWQSPTRQAELGYRAEYNAVVDGPFVIEL